MKDEGLFKGNTSYWTTKAYKNTFIILSFLLQDLILPFPSVIHMTYNLLSLFGKFYILRAHALLHTGRERTFI